MAAMETSGVKTAGALTGAYFAALSGLLGENGLLTLLRLAGVPADLANPVPGQEHQGADFAEMSRVETALQDLYGVRAAANLSRNAGRTAVTQTLPPMASNPGPSGEEDRASAPDQGLDPRLMAFVRLLTGDGGEAVRIESAAGGHTLLLNPCPSCWGRSTAHPICHLVAGMLEGLLARALPKGTVHVEEIRCHAAGADACAFNIPTLEA